MYKVNEKEILKKSLFSDLFVTYSNFEYIYKTEQDDLTIYLEFFYQIYYSLSSSDFSPEEFSIQYIGKYDKFDKAMLNFLFISIRNIAQKYGVRMDRLLSDDMIYIHFNKSINRKIYYVDNEEELEKIRESLAA